MLLAATAVVAALALGACGGSDDEPEQSSTSAQAAPANQAAEPGGAPIKVMVVAPKDGTLQDNPGVVAGTEAAALAINADGGISGRPLEILFCNGQGDPNKTAACARQAVDEEVVAVVPYVSTVSPQLYPPLEQAGIPVIGSLPSQPADWESDVAYPIVPGITQLTLAVPQQIKAHGIDTFAGILIDISSARPQEEAMEQGAQAAGIEFAGPIYHPVTAGDFAPFVQDAESQGAGAASIISTDEATIQLVQAAAQLGLDLTFTQTAQSVDPKLLLDTLGDLGDGILLPSGLPPLSAAGEYPGMQQFVDEMKAAGDAGVDGADQLEYATESAWLGAHAIAIVGEQVQGELDAASLKAALDDASDVDLLGLVNWDPGKGPAEYPRLSNGTTYFTISEGGEFVMDSEVPDPVDIFEVAGLE